VIDIKTFMLVLAMGNIGFAMLMAGYARGAVGNPALRLWTWAKLVQGCAHLLGFMRPDLPYLWVSLAANTALVAGIALEVGAYSRFFSFRFLNRLLVPFALLAILALHGARLGGATGNQLSILMSVIIALLTGSMAAILLRPGRKASLLQRLIGANDLMLCLAMSIRAGVGVVEGDLSVFTPGLVQTFTYIIGFLLMIVNGFGFLLLCKEKDDHDMQRLATIDGLTGLVNRQAFLVQAERARALAARLRKPISLMMLDIDHFKNINDRFGHATGDQALSAFSATAQLTLREHDIMGRLGGEEFALVLPGTDLAGALQAAERLRCAVCEAPPPAGGKADAMTVSVGVVTIDPNEHISEALARADHALYAAKSAGRNRVEAGAPVRKCA